MKLQKFAKLAQRTGLCEAYGGPAGGMILSCGSAVFPAQELPAAENEEQLRAMLDIAPEKQADRWDHKAAARFEAMCQELQPEVWVV